MWNLEKWYRSYLQNRDRCREHTWRPRRGKEGGGMNWKIGIDIYTSMIPFIGNYWELTMKHRELHSVLCGALDGKETLTREAVCITKLMHFAAHQKLTKHCKVTVCMAQSYLVFCGPMACTPPDSSVHRISQPRILERVVISSSRGSSRPRDWVQRLLHWQVDLDPLPLSHLGSPK